MKDANTVQKTAAPASKDAARTSETSAKKGLRVERMLTSPEISAFDAVEWEKRSATILEEGGKVIFNQDDVEVPKTWSVLATNIVASKYFYGDAAKGERESSVRQLVHRVCRTIADWGLADGYFSSHEDAETYYEELCAICVNQYGAFNSPVWFNVGLHQQYAVSAGNTAAYTWSRADNAIVRAKDAYLQPQVSACFIQSVNDTIEGIMHLATSEALLFKYGSGSGTDLSPIRSCREKLSGGGTPSGPLSFMRVYDQVAGVIKSGGKTRRAAKMQSLKVGHPDIMEFITCKRDEERKALALVRMGYDGSFCGEAFSSVMFQNANLSVRVTDEFMKAVLNDEEWQTRSIRKDEVVDTLRARDVMKTIADCAHACGDPGLQYDTTINRWHTCAQTSRINASNPCSEYMFVDDSACNLASVNLMKFLGRDGTLDTRRFQHVVRMLFIAQEILVDNASYPTEDIARNSHLYRPLGLGYANLGALIMNLGMAYDSDAGRSHAAAITALLTGYAYATSIEMARVKGPFDTYENNRTSMKNVIHMHHAAVGNIDAKTCPWALLREAREVWAYVEDEGQTVGFRNAQATVLAPTGTIGFMMDCDTTGVEPDIALVKYKQMAGGGMMKIVNQSVPGALRRRGYAEENIQEISAHLKANDTIEGAPSLKEADLSIFDCAFKAAKGTRYIPYMAHLKMMSAVQPFISGAISKTINMPNSATPEEIMQVYINGWKMGLKAVAIYRDGSKGTQPVSTGSKDAAKAAPQAAPPVAVAPVAAPVAPKPYRRRMDDTRRSITHKFEIAGHEGYLHVGLYDDGAPGELFITMAKEGSTVGGIMDAFGTAISMCLQYGVPMSVLVKKFCHMRFEPSGFTKNPEIRHAKSLVDYIFRWMAIKFPEGKCDFDLSAPTAPAIADDVEAASAVVAEAAPLESESEATSVGDQFRHFMEDAPICEQCGAITVRNGACYRCHNCGNSMGCS